MKERPILFCGAMVRAILAGSKTQTRRVVNPQPVSNGYDFDARSGDIACHCDYLPPDCLVQPPHYDHPFLDQPERMCPYGEPGDRLWVREASWAWGRWQRNGFTKSGRQKWKFVESTINARPRVFEKPEGPFAKRDGHSVGWSYRHARFMPRSASRITLAVTSVRVERLQAITGTDAIAEGIAGPKSTDEAYGWDPYYAFRDLWDSINGKRPGCAWTDNPWVWVVGFRRVTP